MGTQPQPSANSEDLLCWVKRRRPSDTLLRTFMTPEERRTWESGTEEVRAAIRAQVEKRMDDGTAMFYVQKRMADGTVKMEKRYLASRASMLRKMAAENSAKTAPTNPSAPAPKPTAPPRTAFPRFWELFPIILPRSVRENVYEPCAEELKEDYARERSRWKGRFSRRWVTFCFTMKTVSLVFQSLWAAAGSKLRKLTLALLAGIVGTRYAEAIRMKLAQWFGLL